MPASPSLRVRATARRDRTARWCAGGALALAILLSACAGGTAPAGVVTDPDSSAYPPCAEQPAAPDLGAVAGLHLPATAVAFSRQELGPLTQVQGVMPLTPLEARAFYEERTDLEVLTVEDERVETEVLVTDGTHRMFVKVQITCAGGSNFTATVGAESAAAALPTSAGG